MGGQAHGGTIDARKLVREMGILKRCGGGEERHDERICEQRQ